MPVTDLGAPLGGADEIDLKITGQVPEG